MKAVSVVIYIAYSKEDQLFVKDLASQLAAAGYPHWYDSMALRETSNWQSVIEQCLRDSALMLVIIAPGIDTIDHVNYAIAYARALNLNIVPVLREATESPWSNGGYIDLTNRKSDQLRELVRHVKAILQPQGDDEWHDLEVDLSTDPVQKQTEVQSPAEDSPDTRELKAEALYPDLTPRLWIQNALKGLESDDYREQIEAAAYLAEVGDPVGVEPLLKALQQPNVHVRKAVVKALGRIKDPRAIPSLKALLEDHQSYSDLREVAANALGLIAHPNTIPVLIGAINNDPEMFVRLTAARALGMMGNLAKTAIYPLARTVQTAQWQRLRRAAVLALGEIGAPEAYPDLLEFISDDDEEVRRDAALMIIKIWGPAGLRDALHHSEWRAREAAVWALGETRSPEAINELLEALYDDDRVVRQSAAWALGSIGDARAVPALLQRLQNERNDKAILLIIWALGTIGHPDAVSTLGEHWLTDRDPNKRETTARALGKIGHAGAISYLRAAVNNDPSPAVRIAIIEAVAQITDSQVVPILCNALSQDDDTSVKQVTTRCLQKIGTPDALECLKRWRDRTSRRSF